MNKSNYVIYYKDENGKLYRKDENGKKWYEGSIETVVRPEGVVFNKSKVLVEGEHHDEEI